MKLGVRRVLDFFIIPAGLKSGISTLVSDHPPLEARLEQLRRLERQLETL